MMMTSTAVGAHGHFNLLCKARASDYDGTLIILGDFTGRGPLAVHSPGWKLCWRQPSAYRTLPSPLEGSAATSKTPPALPAWSAASGR